MFSLSWFKQYQKILLFFLNIPLLKGYFRHSIGIDDNLNNKICEVYPHVAIYSVHGNNRAVFRNCEYHGMKLYSKYLWLWRLIHTWDMVIANKFAPGLNLGFDVLDFYPDANPETSSVDGYIVSSSDALDSWSNIKGGTSDNLTASSSSLMYLLIIGDDSDPPTNSWKSLRKVFCLFDTKALGPYANVTSATLDVQISNPAAGYEQFLNDAEGSAYVTPSLPASDTNIVASDWGNVTDEKISDALLPGDFPTTFQTKTVTFTINTNSLTYIKIDDITRLALRLVCEIDDVEPSVPSGEQSHGFIVFDANTTPAPKLTVDYVNEHPPVINNVGVENISRRSCEIVFDIIDAGKLTPSEIGAVISTTPNPTITDTKVAVTGVSKGRYTAKFTGLTANTEYFINSYVTNSKDTYYG